MNKAKQLWLCILVVSSVLVAATPGEAQGLLGRVNELEIQLGVLQGKVLALEAAARPLFLSVNCANGETVHDALEAAGDRAAAVMIEVSGFCAEDATIRRSNTTVRAVGAGDGLRSLALDGGHGIRLEGLTLTGGGLVATHGASFLANDLAILESVGPSLSVMNGSTGELWAPRIQRGQGGWGVWAYGGSSLALTGGLIQGSDESTGCVVQGSSLVLVDTLVRGHNRGIWLESGVVMVSGGAVEDNANIGILVGAGTLETYDATIRDNGWAGLVVEPGGSAQLSGGSVNANGSGIGTRGGVVGLRGVSVQGNRGLGIEARNSANLLLFGTTVADNLGSGISLGDVSFAEFSGDPVVVTGNGGWGFRCDPSPAVAQYRDYGALSASGNFEGDIDCTQI